MGVTTACPSTRTLCEKMKYIQIQQGSELPEIASMAPFRVVVVIEEVVSAEWQSIVSEWLVKSGCLYMMAWGNKCSSWDDSVDYANLSEFKYQEIPANKLVITTWHENEPLKEVFWFSKNNANHSEVKIKNTLVLHISNSNNERKLSNEYKSA